MSSSEMYIPYRKKVMVVQFPLEVLTRLRICVDLSSDDGGFNISVQPFESETSLGLAEPLPTGYQINFETNASDKGNGLEVSISLAEHHKPLPMSTENMLGAPASTAYLTSGPGLSVPQLNLSVFEVPQCRSDMACRDMLDAPAFHGDASTDLGQFAALHNDMALFQGMHDIDEYDLISAAAMFTEHPFDGHTDLSEASDATPPHEQPSPPPSHQPSSPLSPPSPPPSSASSSSASDRDPGLRKRKRAAATTRTFKCGMGCGEYFSRQHDRFRHQVLQHDQPCPWTCKVCHKFFASQKNLDKHACSTKLR
ncbi:hypothetical protein GGG16DRAFT_113840 [Schizophyllum commune]